MPIKKNLLILGGSEFVGRQVVERLPKDIYDIYLFNRGKTNSHLFPELNRITGDRQSRDIEKIGLQEWDTIIDFSSYFPDSLEKTLKNINRNVRKYIYISTISVYPFKDYNGTFKIKEDWQKREYSDYQIQDRSSNFYGERKSACEDVLQENNCLNSIVLRPSVIYGKYDPTDRFYYWIDRIKNRKRILLPDSGKYHNSLTYADDLTNNILALVESAITEGTFNCVSIEAIKFRELLEAVKTELGSDCEFIPIEQKRLEDLSLGVQDFPLCWGNNLMIDNSKLAGMKTTLNIPFEEALRSTIKYYQDHNWPKPKVGLSYLEEDEVLSIISKAP